MTPLCPVVHFEMPAEDQRRMATFYERAFGWRTQMLGEDMGGYVLATTTETDAGGPVQRGAINGGFFHKRPESPVQHPTVVIAVEDIQAAIARVAEAGGQVPGPVHDMPGVGSFVQFKDTEGNWVGMLQPVPRNWHAPQSR